MKVSSENDKPFSQFLMEQRGGGMHGELSEKLREVVAAVVEHGKAGQMILTIKVTPLKAAEGQYVVVDDVKCKTPEGDRGASLYFADEDGNLSRSNPSQPELPLREIPADDGTAREVGA